jgi:hypothetical protein
MSPWDGVTPDANAVPATSMAIAPINIINAILRGFFISVPHSLLFGWLVEIYPLRKLYIIEQNNK